MSKSSPNYSDMEAPWSYDSWDPTAGIMGKWDEPPQPAVEMNIKRLRDNARILAGARRDPEARCQIAQALLALGYPEIAAGEALKAIMLSEAALDAAATLEASLQSQLKISSDSTVEDATNTSASPAEEEKALKSLDIVMQKSYLVLIDSLELLGAFPDMIATSKQALKKFTESKVFKERLELAQKNEARVWNKQKRQAMAQGLSKSAMAWGMSMPTPYPWMPENLLFRDAQSIAAANKSLASYSTNLEVRVSSLVKNQDANKPACVGMHAKCDIKKGEIVLDAPCATGINTRQVSGHCYNCAARLSESVSFQCCPTLKFCSDTCKNIAEENYHKAICGKDFTKLYEAAKSSDFVTRSSAQKLSLFLRIFAICKQSGDHPLRNPAIAWLVPHYSNTRDSMQPWSLDANIKGPLNVLQLLGEDIYLPKYDTWVLQTLWNRVKNNTRAFGEHGGLQQTILHPLYAFFNHSCAPNTYEKDSAMTRPTSRIVKYASKDIKKGEEAFTTYIHPGQLVLPKQLRQHILQNWLGNSKCACQRCKTELF